MNRGGGMLRHRFNFQSEGEAIDELGNPVPGGAPWDTQFSERASIIPKHGGEAIIAGRLAGRQTYILTVRSSEQTRQIGPDWRAVMADDPPRIFAVRSAADPDGRRQWIEILVEEGVAA